MTKSLKREQVDLLRFEKDLLALGAGLAALSSGAAANAKDAVGGFSTDHVALVQKAYLNLVEAVQTAHSAIEAGAVNMGLALLQAQGQPKEDPPVLEAAKAILGMG